MKKLLLISVFFLPLFAWAIEHYTLPENIALKLEQLLEDHRRLAKRVDQLKTLTASSAGSDLISQAQKIEGIKSRLPCMSS